MSRVTKATPISRDEFLALFDEGVRERIVANIDKPDTVGIVCFENLDFCSSQLGHRSAVIFGPTCSCKTLDEILDKRLGDVPSRFQYPTQYYVKPAKFADDFLEQHFKAWLQSTVPLHEQPKVEAGIRALLAVETDLVERGKGWPELRELAGREGYIK